MQIASMPWKYGSIFPRMMDEVFTGVERRISPFRSIRSFMMLIIKNCEVK